MINEQNESIFWFEILTSCLKSVKISCEKDINYTNS